MFHQVCAITGWSAVQINLLYQTASDQCFQTIINGAERDRRNVLLCTQKDLRRGRMIRLLHQHAQYLLALFGEPDTAGR